MPFFRFKDIIIDLPKWETENAYISTELVKKAI